MSRTVTVNISNQIKSATIKNQVDEKNQLTTLAKNVKPSNGKLLNERQKNPNIPLNQDAIEVYKRLGKMLQKQGKAAEAWQWYTKAISVAPRAPEIYRDLGSLYGQQQ